MEHCACGVAFKYIPVILGRSEFGVLGALILYCFSVCLIIFFPLFKNHMNPLKTTDEQGFVFFFFHLVLYGVKAGECI